MSSSTNLISAPHPISPSRWGIRWAKVSALVTVANFCLVLFNLTYLQVRPFYARYLPSLVTLYDPIKVIQPANDKPLFLKTSDHFWVIDRFFIVFFAIEFLVETWFLSRRKPGLTWLDAILRRWYEVFLFIPLWQGLRIFPVLVRLYRAQLLNLNRLVAQLTYEPIAYLADTLSEYMIVRVINHAQKSIEQGEATRLLLQPSPERSVSQNRLLEQIINRFVELTIYKVLPRVQPELEALVHSNLENAIKQSDFYQILQGFSPIDILPTEATEQLATYLAQTAVDVVATTYEEGTGRKLIDSLSQEFNDTLRRELQNETTLAEIQVLLSTILEEVKLNYIQGGIKPDPEETFLEIYKLRQVPRLPIQESRDSDSIT